MEAKRFIKNDDGFVCAVCGFHVPPMKKSSRNHCPKCLCSLHLDVNPGDRASDCGGILRPIACTTDPRHGFVITHKCEKCGELRRNKAAYGAGIECPDSTSALIRLTAGIAPDPEKIRASLAASSDARDDEAEEK